MNPEGLERPRFSRRAGYGGTMREFRDRLNMNPTRFTLNKYIPIINTGEYLGDDRIFWDRFAEEVGQDIPYEHEEVNLSTITEDDVVLFADSNFPFWTAHRTFNSDESTITEHKITFRPCGVRRKIGEHVIQHMGRLVRTGNYEFWNKPINYRTTTHGNAFCEVHDDFYRFLPDRTDKQKVLSLSVNTAEFNGHEKIVMNRKMCCRNGERREIKVRKFTGSDDEMRLWDDHGKEAMHRVFHPDTWRVNDNYYQYVGSFIQITPIEHEGPRGHNYVDIPYGECPEGENENYD